MRSMIIYCNGIRPSSSGFRYYWQMSFMPKRTAIKGEGTIVYVLYYRPVLLEKNEAFNHACDIWAFVHNIQSSSEEI